MPAQRDQGFYAIGWSTVVIGQWSEAMASEHRKDKPEAEDFVVAQSTCPNSSVWTWLQSWPGHSSSKSTWLPSPPRTSCAPRDWYCSVAIDEKELVPCRIVYR
jgi:hypothetical protein